MIRTARSIGAAVIVIGGLLLAGCAGSATVAAEPESTGPSAAASAPAPAAEAVTGPSGESGTWGGLTFPGTYAGYRLIGEAEFAHFMTGKKDCTFLNRSLTADSARDGLSVSAYYTKQSEPLTPGKCGFISDTLSVLSSHVPLSSQLTADPADANGNYCWIVATHQCYTQVGDITWVVSDLSSDIPLAEVSDLMAGLIPQISAS